MASFPRLHTGAVTQYPSSRRLQASTCVTRFVDGSEQRFRELRVPVQHWILRLDRINDEELNAYREFFATNDGQLGSFTFVDPWDGTEYPDCSFDMDSVELTITDEGRCYCTAVIRNNQV